MGVRRWGLASLGVALASLGGCGRLKPAAVGAADAGDDATALAHVVAADADARPRVVMVAGTPSHGPGEHEYTAGAFLLQRFLGEVGVEVEVVRGGWPADPTIFDGARAIGFFSDGNANHPLVVGDRLDVLSRALARGAGFFCLHWAVHFPDDVLPRVLPLLGGAYSNAISVNPVWTATYPDFPEHPATHGLTPFSLMDEWYYNLAFATDRPALPLLAAVPPASTRFTADAAMHPGRRETTSWAYERPDGGRAFGYTGLHYHSSWGEVNVRRLVTNAVLWTAGLDVPPGGAPVTFDPAWLLENLDPKTPVGAEP
jgi:hypothetical protein